MKNILKKNAPFLGVFLAFLILIGLYFIPVFQGKKLLAGDIMNASAMMQEIMHYKQNGIGPLWTNSMFGGMPSYQIWAQYPANIASHLFSWWNAVFPYPVNIALLYLLGGYFLFRMLKCCVGLSFLGAVAIAFSSYNFIILEAGHTGKAMAIAFFAPVLGSVLMAFRQGNRVKAASLLALFLALEIRANHLQMTYYLMLMILVIVGAYFVEALKKRELKNFIHSSLALLIGAVIGIGVNAGFLGVNYEYAQESIRGKSDLIQPEAGHTTSKGLTKDYAYQWSEGVMESVTFLIPDAYGGGSGIPFSNDSEVYKVLVKNGLPSGQAADFAGQLGGAARYWGDKPFTSGPYYFGASVLFLFLLGLIWVRGALKWGLGLAALLSVMLSWGRNFQGFSDLFFDYFPLYSKFRAVESILVIAGLAVPILAILALKQVLETLPEDKAELNKKIRQSVLGLGGFLLVFIAVPTAFLSFTSPNDPMLLQQLQAMTGPQLGVSLIEAISDDRIAIARADAFRSLLFVLLTALALWSYVNGKLKLQWIVPILSIVFIFDLWTIDKRYLNDAHFVDKRKYTQSAQPYQVDLEIQQDKGYYRVYDLTGNSFSNPRTSNFHKSIGGYHAAKLKRYQNLIDSQLVKGNFMVFNMLNTKYFILEDEQGRAHAEYNDKALGNAWFVDKVLFVKNATEELQALDTVNPAETAIIGADFQAMINSEKLKADTSAWVRLQSYHPEKMIYESQSNTEQIAVFSEIYYDKGWNAYVDGTAYPYFRTDFLLRGMQLPAGKHQIEFRFEPKTYYWGERISLVFSILLVGGLFFAFFKKRNNEEDLS